MEKQQNNDPVSINRFKEKINPFNLADVSKVRMQQLAPRPTKLEDTGLSEPFVADLIGKHLLDGGILALADLIDRLGTF